MKPRTKLLILLIFGFTLIILAACTPIPNCAATYTVTKIADTNDGVCSLGDCSLREAVLNANACPGSHVINLPTGGYTLTLDGDDEDLGETGDLDITNDLSIIGTGGIPSINGGIERAFHIHSGVNVTFDMIWLGGGSAIFGGGMINEGNTTLNSFTCNYNSVAIPPGGMGDAMGGCIFNTGDLTILGGHFLENTAGYGGAIYNNDNAVLTIEDGNFYGNTAESHGGAIWNGLNASLNINGGLYRLNEAGVNGGALWNHGTVDAQNIVLEENTAGGSGGGFYNWTPGFAVFTNSWFNDNASNLGGGLYNSEGMVHLYESGLSANTAATGGGAYNQGPGPGTGLLLKNVTVSGNESTSGQGGGIYTNSNFDFRFITVANNSGEGLRIDGGTEIKLRSSALSNNIGGNCAGLAPDSLDYNIENGGSCALSGLHDLPATDPLLEPLAANGGMAPSHALGLGSPAIDSGVPDLCIAIDQNGTSRPQGAWCDRGAHENISYDLVITDITLNGTDRIECHYENQGSAVMPEGRDIWIDVILGPGESEVPPFTAANIGVGTSFVAGYTGWFTTAPISPVPAWPHLVTCRIDPSNQIQETDETNNSLTLTLSPLTPTPPSPAPSKDGSSECDPFAGLEISVFTLNINPETLVLPVYLRFPEIVPELGEEGIMPYRGVLGTLDSNLCNQQGFEDRLYCMFTLPPTAPGSALNLEIFKDGCENPVFTQPKLTIPQIPEVLSCKPDLPNEKICNEAGGKWDRYGTCICPPK